MSLYLDSIEEKALTWNSNNKQPQYLLSGYDFFAAYCWSFKNKERCSDLARELIEQSYLAQGGSSGWNSFLRRREYCDRCDEIYKLENLYICTSCNNTYCYKCSRPCFCGGEIVG